MSLPAIGKSAPSFSLPDQNGNIVTLESLKGKTVVLYFYPKAMTPGCTVQACSLRDSQSELNKLGVVVLGVSPDPVNKLQKFIEKEILTESKHQHHQKTLSHNPEDFAFVDAATPHHNYSLEGVQQRKPRRKIASGQPSSGGEEDPEEKKS